MVDPNEPCDLALESNSEEKLADDVQGWPERFLWTTVPCQGFALRTSTDASESAPLWLRTPQTQKWLSVCLRSV